MGIADIGDLKAVLKDTKGGKCNIYPDIGFNLDTELPDPARANMEYELERFHATGNPVSARRGTSGVMSLLSRAADPIRPPSTSNIDSNSSARGNQRVFNLVKAQPGDTRTAMSETVEAAMAAANAAIVEVGDAIEGSKRDGC